MLNYFLNVSYNTMIKWIHLQLDAVHRFMNRRLVRFVWSAFQNQTIIRTNYYGYVAALCLIFTCLLCSYISVSWYTIWLYNIDTQYIAAVPIVLERNTADVLLELCRHVHRMVFENWPV